MARQPKPRVIPPGLEDASFDVRVPEQLVDFRRAYESWRELPLSQTRDDDRGIRGVARGDTKIKPFHAHYSLDFQAERKEYVFRLELAKGTHGPAEKQLPRLSEVLDQLTGFLAEPERRFRGLLSANFNFPLGEWQPTIKLPFSLPGTLDHVPGLPEISGLDFSFEDLRPEQPLRRAFVTTYDAINEMVLRLLLSHATAISGALVDRMLDVASTHYPVFVTRIPNHAE